MPHRPAASGRSRRPRRCVISTSRSDAGRASAREHRRRRRAQGQPQRRAVAQGGARAPARRRPRRGVSRSPRILRDAARRPAARAARVRCAHTAGNGSPRSRTRSGATWRTACGLMRQRGQVVAIVDRALPPKRCRGCVMRVPSRPTMVTVVAPTQAVRSSPAHAHGTEYHAPCTRASARGAMLTATAAPRRQTATSSGRRRRCSSAKRAPMVASVPCRRVSRRASSCASSCALIASSVSPRGNRRQRLQPDVLAAGLRRRPCRGRRRADRSSARKIVRGERRKADRQRPLAAGEDPGHRRFEIVVREARRHAAQCAKARTWPSRKLT